MDWYQLLFSVRGRTDQRTSWWAFACILLGWTAVLAVDAIALSGRAKVVVPYIGFAIVGYCYAMLAVKRLHDRNRSGWWLLLAYGPPAIAIAGIQLRGLDPRTSILAIALDLMVLPALWAFAELFCLSGTRGPNSYGPDPLSRPPDPT